MGMVLIILWVVETDVTVDTSRHRGAGDENQNDEKILLLDTVTATWIHLILKNTTLMINVIHTKEMIAILIFSNVSEAALVAESPNHPFANEGRRIMNMMDRNTFMKGAQFVSQQFNHGGGRDGKRGSPTRPSRRQMRGSNLSPSRTGPNESYHTVSQDHHDLSFSGWSEDSDGRGSFPDEVDRQTSNSSRTSQSNTRV